MGSGLNETIIAADDSSWAGILMDVGVALMLKGEVQAAVDHFCDAAVIFERFNDSDSASRAVDWVDIGTQLGFPPQIMR